LHVPDSIFNLGKEREPGVTAQLRGSDLGKFSGHLSSSLFSLDAPNTAVASSVTRHGNTFPSIFRPDDKK